MAAVVHPSALLHAQNIEKIDLALNFFSSLLKARGGLFPSKGRSGTSLLHVRGPSGFLRAIAGQSARKGRGEGRKI